MNKKERNDLLQLLDFRIRCWIPKLPFYLDGERHKLDTFEMSAIAMYVRFGAPCVCLYCRIPINVKDGVIKEIDQWFCSKHCPVCYQQEWLNNGQYGGWRG